MTIYDAITDPTHVDEPQLVAGYADVLSQVAANQRPAIVRRGGEDFAAVIPLAFWELVKDALARQEAERIAAQIDWDRLPPSPPPQSWFDEDELKPF